MSSSRINPRKPQLASEISWQGLNLRKHLIFVSETSQFVSVPSFSCFIMTSSGNNPRNPQSASKVSWQGLNLRKHLKFISETSKYVFVPSYTYFESQVLEIIPEILKKPRKSAGRANFWA